MPIRSSRRRRKSSAGRLSADNKTVFATSHSLAVFSASGQPLQVIELSASVTSQPLGFGQYVYVGVGATGGRIDFVDVDQEINPIVHQILTNGPLHGVAAVQGEAIFAGSEDGSVVAFYADDTPAWSILPEDRFTTHGKIYGDVAADKEVAAGKSGVYFTSTDGELYCVDSITGKLKWKYFGGTALTTGPQVTDKYIFQFVPGQGLVAIAKHQSQALNTSDNAELDEAMVHAALWTAPHGRRLLSIDKRYAYVLSDNNSVLAIDLGTGHQMFHSRRTDLAVYATNLNAPTIYAATRRD